MSFLIKSIFTGSELEPVGPVFTGFLLIIMHSGKSFTVFTLLKCLFVVKVKVVKVDRGPVALPGASSRRSLKMWLFLVTYLRRFASR